MDATIEITTSQVPLARPYWTEQEYHRNLLKEVTVLICQRKTRDLIQLCLSSLLTHYPEISILVVDGDSQDDSSDYLEYMSKKHPNVTLWSRVGRNSHGETMHDAIKQYITTSKVLLLDSDTRVHRGGFIEGMLAQFKNNPRLYATGSLMLVSRKNEACGDPFDASDILRYAHPSCSMYHVGTYKQLNVNFCDHGAPCVTNMIAAEQKGLQVEYYPVDKYVQHLCGASWQEVPTVWDHDGGVFVRPLITFILTKQEQLGQLMLQTDHDYNIITKGNLVQKRIGTYKRPFDICNNLYDIRFRVTGDYVCELNESVAQLDPGTIQMIRKELTLKNVPNELVVGGLLVIERKHWQETHSMT